MVEHTKQRRRGRGLAVAGVLILALAACGPAGERGSGEAPARVAIRSFAFVPAEIRVEPGAQVTWTNADDIAHTVTTGTAGEQGVPGVTEDTPARADGIFDRRLDGEGTSGSFTFARPGTYAYYCSIHAGMTGTVEVREAEIAAAQSGRAPAPK